MPIPYPAHTRPPASRLALQFGVAVLLVLAVYLPSVWHAQFLDFDDPLFFDPQQGALHHGLRAVLDPRLTIANVYLPVSHFSLWLDWWLYGGAPFGPHLTSLLLHAAAAVALSRWLLAMRLSPLLANVVALLFLLHPALAESAAWVSGRKDILSGLFVFLALGSTARYCERPTGLRLCGIGLLTVLAMYSKATAMVLPPFALAVCLFQGGSARRFLAPLVQLLVTLPILWHHQLIAAAEGTMAATAASTFAERLPQAPGALLHYLQQSFWPHALNILYPEVQTLERFVQVLWPATAVVLAAAGFALLAFTRTRLRLAGLGMLLLLLALLPFNTVFPASAIAAADRYLYLAIPGAALCVVALAAALVHRGAVVGVALALPLAMLTQQRAHAFENSDRAWQASLAVDPDNAVALLNQATELQKQHPYDYALFQPVLERARAAARYPIHQLRAERALTEVALYQAHYQEAALCAKAAIDAAERLLQNAAAGLPHEQALAQLQSTLLLSFQPLQLGGDSETARAAATRAQQLWPDAPQVVAFTALLDIGAVEQQLQKDAGSSVAADDARTAPVLARLQRALADDPRQPGLCYAMGRLQLLFDHQLEALKFFRRAIEADPRKVEAYLAAAMVCLHNNMNEEAVGYARTGLMARNDPQLRYALAMALVAQTRMDDAIDNLELYARMRPKDRDAGRMLSQLLCAKAIAGMGDKPHAELERLLQQALYYNPDEPRVEVVRGKLCRDRRQFAEAVAHLEKAHDAFPDLEDATLMLAQSYRDLGYSLLLEQKVKDEDGAIAAWQKFLATAPPEIETDAVKMQLQAMWARSEKQGVEQLQQGDKAAAAVSFRRCLWILPQQHWASWLLATALYGQPGADLTELERLTKEALQWQQQHQTEKSRQVLLRVLVLQQLHREEQALQVLHDYLAKPDEDADPQVLKLLQQAGG